MYKISKKAGMISLVFCSLLWSSGGLFIKLIDWHPMVICGLRGLIASGIIFLVTFKLFGLPVIDKRAVCSAFFLGLACSLFVVANKLTTAANAIMLQSTNPIFVLLFCAVFKGEKPSRRDMAAAALVFFGISLFFFDQLSLSGLLGSLVGLASGVCLAAAFIFTCEAANLHESMSGVLLGHLFSAVLSLPFFLLYPPVPTAQSVVSILALGVFQLGISYALFSVGASACPPLAVSLLGMLEPVFNPVWVAIFVHEIPGPPALCGSAIVMVTLAVWCVANAKASHSPA